METLTIGLNDDNRLIYPLPNQTPSSTITSNSVYCFENKCFSPKIVRKGSNTFSLKKMDLDNLSAFAVILFLFFCCLFTMIFIDYFLFTSNSVDIAAVIINNLVCGIGIILLSYNLAQATREFLILNPNSIILKSKMFCCIPKSKKVYNSGELEKAAIIYQTTSDEDGTYNYYNFYLILKSGKKKCFFILNDSKNQDIKNFYEFIDLLNNHIENNMK